MKLPSGSSFSTADDEECSIELESGRNNFAEYKQELLLAMSSGSQDSGIGKDSNGRGHTNGSQRDSLTADSSVENSPRIRASDCRPRADSLRDSYTGHTTKTDTDVKLHYLVTEV